MCGFIKGKNKIYVLSPLICQKVSKHTENAIYKVVIHELVHLFIKKADWKFLINCNFITNPKLNWTKIGDRSGYNTAYLLVSFLLRRYGKNKLMRLLNINANKSNATKKLEQVLEISLEEFINNFQKSALSL